jgi:glutaminyl-peptide cyclotransferase
VPWLFKIVPIISPAEGATDGTHGEDGYNTKMDDKTTTPPRKLSGQTLFLAGAVMISIGVVVAMAVLGNWGGGNDAEAAAPRLTLENIPFNGARAYGYLKQICALGPRRSGSAGMAAQQKLLTEHFQKLGGKVELQRFRAWHPVDGSEVQMANLIVRWNPESKERILLCAHYDTRPFPSEEPDPQNRRGTFVGANDGASGVALLMELGREIPKRQSRIGVDFVLFDGEEFVFDNPDPLQDRYFLGSEYFARTYATGKPGFRYRWGVLLDMVGDADLQIYQEFNSMAFAGPLVRQIWSTAARLGVRDFVPKVKHEVRDDHLMLHNLGGIPACDIIDFDYPAWHTRADTPERCSALSLAKVGWVLSEWLKTFDGKR